MRRIFKRRLILIWQVADHIMRGAFKENDFGEMMLPFVLIRRLDRPPKATRYAVIANKGIISTKQRVLDGKAFGKREDRISQKLKSRMERVKTQLILPNSQTPTIFGPEGFAVG